jgi:excisionase family DNA binding protein
MGFKATKSLRWGYPSTEERYCKEDPSKCVYEEASEGIARAEDKEVVFMGRVSNRTIQLNKMGNLKNLFGNEWSESEDQAMLDLINRYLSPRIRWAEISESELIEGRTKMAMKERMKRLNEFLVFQNERFQIDVKSYQAHKDSINRMKLEEQKKRKEKEAIRNQKKSIRIPANAMDLRWDFMTTAETAEVLRVTPTTIRNMVKDKRLKSINLGNSHTIRIPRSEIERLLS